MSENFYSSKKSDLWYTPLQVIQAVKYFLGEIELDTASDTYGNSRIKATRYYTKEDNGLILPWKAKTVFCNPPFSLAKKFSERFISEFEEGNIGEGLLLVNACTSEKWFQPLYSYPILFSNKRIKFDNSSGEKGKQNTKGQAIILFSRSEYAIPDFAACFKDIGTVMRRFEHESSVDRCCTCTH